MKYDGKSVALNGMEVNTFKEIYIRNDLNNESKYEFRLNQFPLPPSFTDLSCWLRFEIRDESGNVKAMVQFERTDALPRSIIQNLNLPSGTYRIYWSKREDVSCPIDDPFTFQLLWTNNSLTNIVGGLRISRLITSDGMSEVVKLYSYKTDIGQSSGRLITIPQYDKILNNYFETRSCFLGSGVIQSYASKILSRSSVTNLPLAYSQGSPIAYERVEEIIGENAEGGKNVYNYTVYPDLTFGSYFGQPPASQFVNIANINSENRPADIIAGTSVAASINYPYTPAISNEWKRGLLLSKEVYKKTSPTNFSMISKIENTYNFHTEILDDDVVRSVKVAPKRIFAPPNIASPSLCVSNPAQSIEANYFIKAYYESSGWVDKTSVTETTIDEKGNQIIKWQTIENDPLYYNTKRVVAHFGTNNTILEKEYKYPYDNAIDGADPVILSELILKNRINEVIQETSRRNGVLYSKGFLEHNAQLYPFKYCYAQRENSPIECRQIFDEYDQIGNVLSMHKPGDVNKVYVYGYNGQYPVAEIIGSDLSTVNSLYDKVIVNDPNSSEEHIVDQLNLIRQGLASTKALVSTYTYIPLVGMKTHTDPNGQTTYYEYDEFNRLQFIKDYKGNILKKFEYKYRHQ